MRLNRCALGPLLAAALLLVGCAARGQATPAPAPLHIAGSTSMAPLLNDLAQAYQAKHPTALIDVRPAGSAAGISELQAGRADLAAVSWHPPDGPSPSGIQAVPVGRDAIGVIVHRSTLTPGLTLLQLRAIFRGDVSDWAAVGGPQVAPVIVSREDGSGTRAAFEALVMGGDRVTRNALVMPGSRAVVDYVASHPGAVGYVSLAWADERVRLLPIEEITPTLAAARAGAYHLTRTLYLYAPQPVPPATQAFLDFVLSPAGQALVRRQYVALR